jgi:hypothetical protein
VGTRYPVAGRIVLEGDQLCHFQEAAEPFFCSIFRCIRPTVNAFAGGKVPSITNGEESFGSEGQTALLTLSVHVIHNMLSSVNLLSVFDTTGYRKWFNCVLFFLYVYNLAQDS